MSQVSYLATGTIGQVAAAFGLEDIEMVASEAEIDSSDLHLLALELFLELKSRKFLQRHNKGGKIRKLNRVYHNCFGQSFETHIAVRMILWIDGRHMEPSSLGIVHLNFCTSVALSDLHTQAS